MPRLATRTPVTTGPMPAAATSPAAGAPAVPGPDAAGTPLEVVLLKNLRYPALRPGDPTTELPYRIDHLAEHGIALRWTDRPATGAPGRGPAGRPPRRRPPGLPDHVHQVLVQAPSLARSDAVLAMFESSAHPYGILRTMLPAARRPPLAVLSCWLPEVLADASPRRRDLYRRAYRTVDVLYHFSRNQAELLEAQLDLPAERVRYLAYGVDHERFRPDAPSSPGTHVLAVGRDRGRDWPTLLAALAATAVPARVLCRPDELAGLPIPPNVTVVGPVDRDAYRAELLAARAVLVVTRVVGYPSGQSVLLEAMAAGRACVATATPALADYLEPGRTALTVPPRDVGALCEALGAIQRGEVDLEGLGRAGRAAVEDRFTARAMWATVASDLHRLAGSPHRGQGVA
jgi:glycosyltransferase involved in cell wall biosynthesis